MEIVLTIGLIALVILNVYASIRCYQNALSSFGQRLAQIACIWLVPLLGASLTLRLLNDETEKSSGMYPEETNSGGDYVTGLGRLNADGYISSPDDNFHPSGGGDASPN
jgi:hypothetical protein